MENIDQPRRCVYCKVQLSQREYLRGVCDECEYGEDDGKDEDFYREQHEREMEERVWNCTCGAWQQTANGTIIHVADCCCGAE